VIAIFGVYYRNLIQFAPFANVAIEPDQLFWGLPAVRALAVATSAQVIHVARADSSTGRHDDAISFGCGASRIRVRGVSIARTTERQVCRCAMWGVGGTLPSMALA
jgi:hypothetical protein